MRWLGVPCMLLLGCRFDLPASPASDGMPVDGPPISPVRTRRIDIIDAQVAGGPHADFPLLVSITQPWLRTAAFRGDVASASGFDIGFFADAAGTTRLAHEVEVYRSDANMGTLVAWVKMPSLSASSELFVRYGDPAVTTSQENAAAVWSNGFCAVLHLSDLGDSTANANAGTSNSSIAGGGRIEGGHGFDGVDDVVSVGSGASIDDVFTDGGTVEAWFRAAGWGEDDNGRIFEKGDTGGWLMSLTTGSLQFGHGATSDVDPLGRWLAPANSVMLNAWTHVAVVYDQGSTNNDPLIYINGAGVEVTQARSPSGSMSSDALFSAQLGDRSAGSRAFNGQLDELRLSRRARSAGWIATSFRNQNAPAAFYTVGPEL